MIEITHYLASTREKAVSVVRGSFGDVMKSHMLLCKKQVMFPDERMTTTALHAQRKMTLRPVPLKSMVRDFSSIFTIGLIVRCACTVTRSAVRPEREVSAASSFTHRG